MVTRLATVSSEGIERISGDFGNMALDYRLSLRPTRKEKLPAPRNNDDDLGELKEEDIWGEDQTVVEEAAKAEVKVAAVGSNGRAWAGAEMEAGEGFRELGRGGVSTLQVVGNGGAVLHATGRRNGRLGRSSSAGMSIPNSNGETGCATEKGRRRGVPQSAPMKVPDWEKVMGGKQQQSDATVAVEEGDFDEEDEDDEGGRLPPHEMLAREYAKSQGTSLSTVLEGTGRTPKSMALRRLRNEVWRHTGFMD